MGINLNYRMRLDKFQIEANCTHGFDGDHKIEVFPVEIVSMSGIDYRDPYVDFLEEESRETFRRILERGREDTGLELDSVSVIFPAGIMLHYAPDPGDRDTEDITVGPWLKRGMDIDVEVKRGSIIPDRYHIFCNFDKDHNELYPMLHYWRDGVKYYMHYEADGYVHVEERRP